MIYTFPATHNGSINQAEAVVCSTLELNGQWFNLFCWIGDRSCPFQGAETLISKASELLQN